MPALAVDDKHIESLLCQQLSDEIMRVLQVTCRSKDVDASLQHLLASDAEHFLELHMWVMRMWASAHQTKP
jgi:hypothetical protein